MQNLTDKSNLRAALEAAEFEVICSAYQFADTIEHYRKAVLLEDVTPKHRKHFEVIFDNDKSQVHRLYVKLHIAGFKTDDICKIGEHDASQNYTALIEQYTDILIKAKSEEYFAEAAKSDGSSSERLRKLEHDLNRLRSRVSGNDHSTFADDSMQFLEYLQNKADSDTIKIRTRNSLPSFNAVTEGGISGGNLIGIAGAWKGGKTTFGLNLMYDFASQGIGVGIITLEMTKNELLEKFFALNSKISYHKIRNPKELNDLDQYEIANARLAMKDWNVRIHDQAVNELQADSLIGNWVSNYGVKVVMIDYLGLMDTTLKLTNADALYKKYEMLSLELKKSAKRHNIPLIVLAQLNREGAESQSASKLAGSIGLARDCDFLFTTGNPASTGQIQVKLNGTTVNINERNFLIKLDASRFTKRDAFLTVLKDNCQLDEVLVSDQFAELPIPINEDAI